MSPSSPDVTQLLVEWRSGNPRALEQLTPLVYDELRRLARHYLDRESAGHTLQATALVHEAFLRLVDQRRVQWQGRAHFLGIAAQMMRRILVDHARAKHRHKRGGQLRRLSLDEAFDVPECEQEVDLVALDDALDALAEFDPQQSRLVELRYFAGLSIEETAEVLEISAATVKRRWTLARGWLRQYLSE